MLKHFLLMAIKEAREKGENDIYKDLGVELIDRDVQTQGIRPNKI